MIGVTLSEPELAGHGGAPTLISSVSRALGLLERVAAAARPLPAKSIARAESLSLGTTYNILRTLIHAGYLAQEADGYVLGPRHPALTPKGDGAVLAEGRTVLNGLRDELRAAAYLTRFKDGEIEIVDIADGPFAPRVDLWVGAQDSAHATAFGKQILASLDQPARLDYIARHPLVELTPYTIHTPREFLRLLDHAPVGMVDNQEYALGFRCLAVPVATSAWIGALAISLPAGSGRPEVDYLGRLRDSAGNLSLALAANDAL